MAKCNVAVVGGGLGGLSAAIRLAHAGFEVQLFERGQHLGGKMNEIRFDGYRFDTGPSLLTMPFVVDELFSDVGLHRPDFLEFNELQPVCRYFWSDGSSLDASTDFDRMYKAMQAFNRNDARCYRSFLQYSRRLYDLTAEPFLFSAVHEWKNLLRLSNLSRLLRIHRLDPFRTVHKGIRRFFSDRRLVQLFDRYATYNGSDPYKAPATLNVIPYVEYELGSFYIKGGMYRLVEELHKIAEQKGVNIRTNHNVDRIIQSNGSASGVTVNGTNYSADHVVCNADVITAHNELLKDMEKQRKKLNRLEPSLSGLVFMWGVAQQTPVLSHHNVLFSTDYKREFVQLFDQHEVPEDPTIYIAITSKSDEDHAPEGHSNWFVLVNMPYLSAHYDYGSHIAVIKRKILNRLRSIGLDIERAIESERTITPTDFEKRLGSNRGSIYGISSNAWNTAFKRPANRSRQVRNLYFTGGSSHPGGGIPLVLLSGKMTADLIINKND